MAECPRCGAELNFADEKVEAGAIFTCAECHSTLDVIGTGPLHLEASPGRAEEAGLEEFADELADDPDFGDNRNLV